MDNKFSYTYSASKNAEVEEIRRKYTTTSKNDERIEKLRKLDRSCEIPGQITAIITGIIGTAAFSLGIYMMFGTSLFGAGAAIGIMGLILMAAAVPVYNIITKAQRKKIANEIIELCDKIEKDSPI